MMCKRVMFTFGAMALSALAWPALAQPGVFPPGFETRDIATEAATLHVRTGGTGPAVVLLHGFGDTGDMWVPLAADLARDHRVVVPDLRGMGLSSRPEGGYDKWTQAGDIRAVLTELGIDRAVIIGHDIGNMVAFAYATRYRGETERLVVMDAPIPGVPPWEDIVRDPRLWHFDFGGPDMERLVAGRERIFLDRFWNDFAANPTRFEETSRQHYAALYARPGAMHAAFAQFAAFRRDAERNRAAIAVKLTMPVLAIGAQQSFGPVQALVMRNAATDVTQVVIPDSGHWLMEEQPAAVIGAVRAFLQTHP